MNSVLQPSIIVSTKLAVRAGAGATEVGACRHGPVAGEPASQHLALQAVTASIVNSTLAISTFSCSNPLHHPHCCSTAPKAIPSPPPHPLIEAWASPSDHLPSWQLRVGDGGVRHGCGGLSRGASVLAKGALGVRSSRNVCTCSYDVMPLRNDLPRPQVHFHCLKCQ